MFSFKKTQRLLNKNDYDHVFEQAKKITTNNYLVLYRVNTAQQARIGFALSKKAIAKAHDRNRLKRILRESFRKTQLPAVDIIFLAKSSMSRQSNLELFSSLNKTWEKISSCFEK